jgi:hypothetical protein
MVQGILLNKLIMLEIPVRDAATQQHHAGDHQVPASHHIQAIGPKDLAFAVWDIIKGRCVCYR